MKAQALFPPVEVVSAVVLQQRLTGRSQTLQVWGCEHISVWAPEKASCACFGKVESVSHGGRILQNPLLPSASSMPLWGMLKSTLNEQVYVNLQM